METECKTERMLFWQLFILLVWYSTEAPLTIWYCLSITSDKFWTRWLIFNHFFWDFYHLLSNVKLPASEPACTHTHRGAGELPGGSGLAVTWSGQHKGWEDRRSGKYRTLYENKLLQFQHSQNQLLKYSGDTWILWQYDHSSQNEKYNLKGLLGIKQFFF